METENWIPKSFAPHAVCVVVKVVAVAEVELVKVDVVAEAELVKAVVVVLAKVDAAAEEVVVDAVAKQVNLVAAEKVALEAEAAPAAWNDSCRWTKMAMAH